MVATGEAPKKTIDRVAKQLQTSKNNAGRVVMTESAHFATESQKECYKELGADEYEVVLQNNSKYDIIEAQYFNKKLFLVVEWRGERKI